MLEARRYRAAAAHLRERLAAEHGVRFRAAPLPPRAAPRDSLEPRRRRYEPARLGEALGGLLRMPPRSTCATWSLPRVTVAERLAHLRGAAAPRPLQLRRGGARRRPGDRGGDAVRAARALQAGEADVEQDEPFGEIAIARRAAARRPVGRARRRARDRACSVRSRRCCSSRPTRCPRPSSPTRSRSERGRRARARAAAPSATLEGRGARAARARPAAGRWPPTRTPRTPRAACSPRRGRRRSPRPRPRRSRSSPTCSRSRDRRSPASAASAPTRPSRTLLERGMIEEAGRSQFGAVLYRTTALFLKLFGLNALDELPDVARWDPDAGGGGRAARPAAASRRGALGRDRGGRG